MNCFGIAAAKSARSWSRSSSRSIRKACRGFVRRSHLYQALHDPFTPALRPVGVVYNSVDEDLFV